MLAQDRRAKELLQHAITAFEEMRFESMSLFCFDGGASVSLHGKVGGTVEYTLYRDQPLTKKVEVQDDDD